MQHLGIRVVPRAAGGRFEIQTVALGKIRLLIERHGGEVPHDRAALEALPGVGRKTANVVLNVAFGEPTMAVDTHVFRVANRTGLAPGRFAAALNQAPLRYRTRVFPVDWLIERKASMAAGYSGRIFRAAILNRQRIDTIWDAQIYDLDLWAIPKSSPHKEAAKRFITFATAPERMAEQAALIAYGPMRKSAIDQVGKNPTLDVEVKTFLPTAPDNFKTALKFDQAFWDAHGEELGKRFKDWRAKFVPAVEAAPAAQTTPPPATPTAAPLPRPPAGIKPKKNRPNLRAPLFTSPD